MESAVWSPLQVIVPIKTVSFFTWAVFQQESNVMSLPTISTYSVCRNSLEIFLNCKSEHGHFWWKSSWVYGVSRIKVKQTLRFSIWGLCMSLSPYFCHTIIHTSQQPYCTLRTSYSLLPPWHLNVLPLEFHWDDFSFSFSISLASASCSSRWLRCRPSEKLLFIAYLIKLLNLCSWTTTQTSINKSLCVPTWNSLACLHFTTILKDGGYFFFSVVF